MTYEVGYLYQRSNDGRDWANSMGPIENNLHITSTHADRPAAIRAGANLIGSPSPMGKVADAYLVRRTKNSIQLLGEIRKMAR